MGSDLFIDYTCQFRKDGDASQIHHLLKLKRYLDAMETGAWPHKTVRLQVRDGNAIREHVYTQADLKMAAAKLAEVYPLCDRCPANLKKQFMIRGTIGCHAYVHRPMDPFAEQILHETLAENARPERVRTDQSNLVRAMVASSPSDGRRWEASGGGRGVSGQHWGNRPVTATLDEQPYEASVYALLEFLFMFPAFPLRAVEDVLSFFRSFFAVVGGYVSTPDGKLDKQRNDRFWRQSPALNELNLYIQLLKHASRIGRGIYALAE